MRFLHISDLHIGKRVNGFSMENEQRHILDFILAKAKEENVRAILMSGDIYDRPVPPVEAVNIFDDFITGITQSGITALIISGNHDSPDRLNFASRLMSRNNVYISSKFSGGVDKCTVDGVNFYMLPFIKPSYVKNFYPDEDIADTQSAVKFILDRTDINENEVNVLLAHQFVTGEDEDIILCESEEGVSLGGTDRVSADLFEKFDYTALGHIHSMQPAGRKNVVYCGSPLKYSASEAGRDKVLCVVNIDKSNLSIKKIPLVPLHDMRVVEGRIDDILKNDISEDYIYVKLTDTEEVINPLGRLRAVFPNLLEISNAGIYNEEDAEIYEPHKMSRMELFAKLYHQRSGRDLSDEETMIMKEIFEELGIQE